jgi:hypothetical protein
VSKTTPEQKRRLFCKPSTRSSTSETMPQPSASGWINTSSTARISPQRDASDQLPGLGERPVDDGTAGTIERNTLTLGGGLAGKVG